jgi:hypothetical protein
MPLINTSEVTHILATGLEDASAFNGDELRIALINPRAPFDYRGVAFGGAEKEIFPLIERAYSGSPDKHSFEFARRVAHSIQEHCKSFYCDYAVSYPHFLLHGLPRTGIDGVVNKIADNSRIIHETIRERRGWFAQNFKVNIIGPQDFVIHLWCGDSEAYHGLNLSITAIDKDPSEEFLAKVGFFIDVTNNSAVVLNLQGQRNSNAVNLDSDSQKSESEPQSLPTEGQQKRQTRRERGREFFKATNKLGMDPRTCLLLVLSSFCEQAGLSQIKAIKSREHPMSIAQHEGFKGNYDHCTQAAGFVESDEVYLIREL